MILPNDPALFPAPVRAAYDGTLRLSAWVAPAVFVTAGPDALAGILAARSGGRRIAIGLDSRGRVVVRLGTVRLTAARSLPTLTWHLVELEFDGDVRLLIDGERAASARAPFGAEGAWDVVVGFDEDSKGDHPDIEWGHLVGVLAGVRTAGAAADRPAADPATLWQDRARPTDPGRPRFHAAPPSGWMNEPHGVLHVNGRHHLFYQRNEAGPFWGSISWGHAVSDNLVDWTDLGSALAPWAQPDAPDGIWSGSSVIDGDEPVLIFTGGDNSADPNQRTMISRAVDATDPDLRKWQPGSVVTTLADAADGLADAGYTIVPGQFRDPFVWRDGDWFQLVGAGLAGRGGTALLFRAPDLEGPWTFLGPLMTGNATRRPDTGVMWELPVLVPVGGGKHAFFVTPWWPRPTPYSLLHEWYWIGTWDPATATFSPDHREPRELDGGGHFTGVTSSVTPDGRTLLWTIAQDLLSDAEKHRRGWAGVTGLPLEASFDDGDLRISPVRELVSLRLDDGETLDSRCAGLVPSGGEFDVGPMAELDLAADLPVGGCVDVEIWLSPGHAAAATISLTRTGAASGVLSVHRPASQWPERDNRSIAVLLGSGPVELRVFLDHSLAEAFAARRRAITTRVWEWASTRCRVATDGGAQLVSARVHRLRAARMDSRRD